MGEARKKLLYSMLISKSIQTLFTLTCDFLFTSIVQLNYVFYCWKVLINYSADFLALFETFFINISPHLLSTWAIHSKGIYQETYSSLTCSFDVSNINFRIDSIITYVQGDDLRVVFCLFGLVKILLFWHPWCDKKLQSGLTGYKLYNVYN